MDRRLHWGATGLGRHPLRSRSASPPVGMPRRWTQTTLKAGSSLSPQYRTRPRRHLQCDPTSERSPLRPARYAPGFGEIVNGAQAYFNLINSQGGVNGRKIYIKYQENDGGSTTNDETEARTLVEQDHVFAVVAVGTAFFTGSTFLAQSGTPTFGYVVTQDWNKYLNLFGAYGSYLDYQHRRAGLRVPLLQRCTRSRWRCSPTTSARHRRPVRI